MNSDSPGVLDASAVLVFLQREAGQERVAAALTHGSAISAVNVSEVVAKLRDAEAPEEIVREALAGLIARGLEVVAFDAVLALASGFLWSVTRPFGLSLGDRACLALGQLRQQSVLTADRRWAEVAPLIGVDVRVIR